MDGSRAKQYEISVSLFNKCNLSCEFCFERHDREIDQEELNQTAYKCYEATKKDIEKYNPRKLVLRFWGGELFYDALPDAIFDTYKKIIDDFRRLFSSDDSNRKFEITFLSNGVFTKRDRVDNLLDYADAKLGFSYDPVGRFASQKQLDTWESNVEYYKKRSNGISIVLTKETIPLYMIGDKYFEKYSKELPISVNFYTPNTHWEKYMLNDDLLFEFFKWCVETKKYNVDIIESIMRYAIPEERAFIERHCDCDYCAQYQDGRCTKDCVKRASTLDEKFFYGENMEKSGSDFYPTAPRELIGINKRQCYICDYCECCPMLCFVFFIFDKYEIGECPLKQIYRYINKEHIESYKKWKGHFNAED